MKRIRVSHLAERDLDEIWYYVAKNSHSMEIANGVVESITSHFLLLAHTPEAGTRPIHGMRDQKIAYFDDD